MFPCPFLPPRVALVKTVIPFGFIHVLVQTYSFTGCPHEPASRPVPEDGVAGGHPSPALMEPKSHGL